MKRKYLVSIISNLLIFLWIYAAVSKLLDYWTFQVQLSKSPFISRYSGIIALSLPIIELLIGVCLALPITRLLGLYSSLFLMTLFTAYLITMLNFSFYIPCSCGGILSTLSWKAHVWFNLVFVGLSIIGIIFSFNQSLVFKK